MGLPQGLRFGQGWTAPPPTPLSLPVRHDTGRPSSHTGRPRSHMSLCWLWTWKLDITFGITLTFVREQWTCINVFERRMNATSICNLNHISQTISHISHIRTCHGAGKHNLCCCTYVYHIASVPCLTFIHCFVILNGITDNRGGLCLFEKIKNI